MTTCWVSAVVAGLRCVAVAGDAAAAGEGSVGAGAGVGGGCWLGVVVAVACWPIAEVAVEAIVIGPEQVRLAAPAAHPWGAIGRPLRLRRRLLP